MFRVLLTDESESDKRWCLHGLSVEKQLSVPGVSSASWYLRRGSGQHRPETRAPDPGHNSHPQRAQDLRSPDSHQDRNLWREARRRTETKTPSHDHDQSRWDELEIKVKLFALGRQIDSLNKYQCWGGGLVSQWQFLVAGGYVTVETRQHSSGFLM